MQKLFTVTACFASTMLLSGALWAEDCKFEKQISKQLDLSTSDSLAVIARAGSLTITGIAGADEAMITGRVCVSEKAWLEEADIETQGGGQARIEVVLPRIDSDWSFFKNHYARLDLELVVPEGTALDVKDSSGSIRIEGVGAIVLKDSSGSIKIENTSGPISVQDSSGSITFNDIRGDVTIVADSSGSINGKNIEGFVLVKQDSSGNIRFTDVTGDFIVEKDSSGSIVAKRIGGDFKVYKDSGGGIDSEDVAGEVSIPAQ